MIDDALQAFAQTFAPPLRRILLKSAALAVLLLLVLGIVVQTLITRLITLPAPFELALAIATGLGLIAGAIYLMGPISSLIAALFVDEVAARLADIAAVQDQPVMRVAHVLRRNHAHPAQLDLERRLARRQAGAVGDAEDVRVDGHGRLAEGHVEHDIGGLAPDAGQRLQRFAVVPALRRHARRSALRQRDDVLRLVAKQADGLDVLAHRVLAERQHLLRRVGSRRTARASPC
jgi:hypothetical protein